MKIRTRFAPSPTGYMHIGNLRTALYCFLLAKHNQGDFILRIEDTDQKREVADAVDMIYQVLAETGLTYDEGPLKNGGVGPYIQSQRLDIYQHYAKELIARGGAHYCFCLNDYEGNDPCHQLSPQEIAEKLSQNIPYVIRQTIPTSGTTCFDDEVYGHICVENQTLNEGILIKSDGYPTYNFANVIDDHLMHITHVVRGNEYLSSTPKYNLIYKAFDWNIPTYIHLPPVNKDETHKLSKRHGDASYQDLKQQGYLKDAIINYIALLGCYFGDQEILSLDELIEKFDISHISKSPAIFDIEKLKWINNMYFKNMSADAFYQLALPFYTSFKAEINCQQLSILLQSRIEKLTDIAEMIDFIKQPLPFDCQLYTHKKMKTNPSLSLNVLKLVYQKLLATDFTSIDVLLKTFITLAKDNGIKNGQVMWPVRIALTNKASTPGGAAEIAYILGKDETLKRIQQAILDLENS